MLKFPPQLKIERVGRLPRTLWTPFHTLGQGAGFPTAHTYYVLEDVVDHYLAFFGEDLVGTVQINRDEEGHLHLHRLFVHPDHRGNDISLDLTYKALRDWNYGELRVIPENDRSKIYFKKYFGATAE